MTMKNAVPQILQIPPEKNAQVLTKIQYYRSIRNLLSMFFIFSIKSVSPKLKKIFDELDFGYVSGRIKMIVILDDYASFEIYDHDQKSTY